MSIISTEPAPNDVAAVESALARLLADPPLRQRMGIAGRKRAVEIFGLEPFIRRVEATFEKARERSKNHPDRDEEARE